MDDCCKKMSAGAVAALPDDLLLEIFSHVPAKFVCRFKCVSKAWHDLVTEAWHDLVAGPDHGKKLCQPMQGLFIMNPGTTEDYGFGLVDLTAGPVPLDVDLSFSFLSPGMCNLVLLDSCNGLILFGHHEPPYYDGLSFIVCNPTTKQWASVPPCSSPEERSSYTFLAFDPAVSLHFHLVQFQESEEGPLCLEALHAYSSETKTWSHNQIESQEEQGLVAGWHRHVSLSYDYEDPCHVFVNGFLYLVVQDLDQRRIVVVDVQGKAKRMITMPVVPNEGRFTCYLEQSQGCVHCITQDILYAPEDNYYKLSIWVLQGHDTQEWVLKITEVFGDLEFTSDIFDIFNMSVVDIHQDHNLVFLFQCQSGKLIACNMDHKEVSVITTVKEWRPRLRVARYVPCFLESPTLTS